MTVSIVLASASPARRKLLHAAGIEPSIVVSAVDEDAVVAAAREAYGDLAAEDIALVLARAKAEDVATEIEGAVVVGCDSVLELDGEVHGKPADAAEAVARWRRMSGSSGCCTPATGSSTRVMARPAAPAPRWAQRRRRPCTSRG